MKSVQEVFNSPLMANSQRLAVFRCSKKNLRLYQQNWDWLAQGMTGWWKMDGNEAPDGIVLLINDKETNNKLVYAAPGAERIDKRGNRWKFKTLTPFQFLASIPTVSRKFLGKQMSPGVIYVQRRKKLERSTSISTEPDFYDPQVGLTVTERRARSLHFRIERNSGASKAAKRAHGTTCQACGFNFNNFYGALGDDYIEAHHLTPLSTLKDNEQRDYDARKDFAVLCANCHRMIHKPGAPADLAAFKRAIRSIPK